MKKILILIMIMMSYTIYGQLSNVRQGRFSCWKDGVKIDDHDQQHKAIEHADNLALQFPGTDILITYPTSITVRYDYKENYPPIDSTMCLQFVPLPVVVTVPDEQVKPKEITIVTTSKHTAWTPSTIVSSDSLSWTIYAQNMDTIRSNELKPVVDLSSAFGDVTMKITSKDNFESLTEFSIVGLYTKSVDVRDATNIRDFSIKLTDELTSVDVSNMPEVWRFTLRSTSLFNLDISNNKKLTAIYAYENKFSSEAIDFIINTLDKNGLSNGIAFLQGNPGKMTAAAEASYQSLLAKGWDIKVDKEVAPPDAPVLDKPTNITTSSVDLNWSPALTGPIAKNYTINQNGIDILTTDSKTVTIDSLANGAVYNYHIIANDSLFNKSLKSNIQSATTKKIESTIDTLNIAGKVILIDHCSIYKPKLLLSIINNDAGDTIKVISDTLDFISGQRFFTIKREVFDGKVLSYTNIFPAKTFHIITSWPTIQNDSTYKIRGNTSDYSNAWGIYGKDSTNLNIWTEQEYSFRYKDHGIGTPGLGLGQRFYFRFYALDSAGTLAVGNLRSNISRSKDTQKFKVLEAFIQQGDLYLTDTTAKIRVWANGQNEIKISLGTSPYNLYEYETDPGFNASNPSAGVYQHGRWLTGLLPDNDYWFKITVTDEQGNTAVSGRTHFKTLPSI